MHPRLILFTFLFCWAVLGTLSAQLVPAFYTHERDAGPGHSLARLTARVLFNAGSAQDNESFLAYGYLSHVDGLSGAAKKEENASSAVLTFFVEGRVVDLEQSNTTFMVKSEGSLRVFFAQQAKRDFSQPDSFRGGEEVATYNLKRYVFFSSANDRLQDRSFASIVSSKPFTFRGGAIDLQRLWGTQLIIEAQAQGRETLPSPLPEYSAAIAYTGLLFIGGERAEQTDPLREAGSVLRLRSG